MKEELRLRVNEELIDVPIIKHAPNTTFSNYQHDRFSNDVDAMHHHFSRYFFLDTNNTIGVKHLWITKKEAERWIRALILADFKCPEKYTSGDASPFILNLTSIALKKYKNEQLEIKRKNAVKIKNRRVRALTNALAKAEIELRERQLKIAHIKGLLLDESRKTK